MIREVVKVDYIRERQCMTVYFNDGTKKTYMSVQTPAADAMLCSGSLTAHHEKYIKPVYFPIEEGAA